MANEYKISRWEKISYRNEGEIEGKVEILINMLKAKIPTNVIVSVSKISKEDIKEITKRMDKKEYSDDEFFQDCFEIVRNNARGNGKLEIFTINDYIGYMRYKEEVIDDSLIEIEKMIIKEVKKYRKEGKIDGKIEIIKNMLKEKLPIDTIVSLSGMNEKKIEKIAKEMN